jgi:hypothetical protein
MRFSQAGQSIVTRQAQQLVILIPAPDRGGRLPRDEMQQLPVRVRVRQTRRPLNQQHACRLLLRHQRHGKPACRGRIVIGQRHHLPAAHHGGALRWQAYAFLPAALSAHLTRGPSS